MLIVSLDEAKSHLRVTDASEDALITLYVDAAEAHVIDVTGEFSGNLATSAAAKAAVLLLVGDFYENREAQTDKPLSENAAVERLLWPLRVWA
jgi:uncharacterized phage protein (predicted DNA packaging)